MNDAFWEDGAVDGTRAEVVWRVARDPQLLRIQLSFVAFAFAEHATWLAILVYAYERGGVREAGVVAAVLLAPAVVLAPFAAYAGDRFRPERVLALGYTAQALSMLATALAMWTGQPLMAYATGAVVATCVTFSRPVMGAILPIVSRHAERPRRGERRDRSDGVRRHVRRTARRGPWCSPTARRRSSSRSAPPSSERARCCRRGSG